MEVYFYQSKLTLLKTNILLIKWQKRGDNYPRNIKNKVISHTQKWRYQELIKKISMTTVEFMIPLKKSLGQINFPFKTDNPIFQATEASNKAGQNFLRDVDTEYKILNDLADKMVSLKKLQF